MSIHWLWWEHSLTRLNSAFVNTPSAVQTTFIKWIRISQLCIDKFLKHLQVSFLLCLLGESLRSLFKRNHLAISCDVIVWFWHLAAVHEAHLLVGFFGDGVGNISSKGFGVDHVNPPLLLDMRAESWCLGAGVWGKYLKILVPGPAMALLITAFSKCFLIGSSIIRMSRQQFFSSSPCFPLPCEETCAS